MERFDHRFKLNYNTYRIENDINEMPQQLSQRVWSHNSYCYFESLKKMTFLKSLYWSIVGQKKSIFGQNFTQRINVFVYFLNSWKKIKLIESENLSDFKWFKVGVVLINI